MEWEASDFVDEDALAGDGRQADRRAFRREMTWRIPLSVFAFLMIWHVLRALVDAVWAVCQRRVRAWARSRRVSTPANADVSMADVSLADVAIVDVAVADSLSASIDGSAR
jgi:hypothetical protein